MTLDPACLSRSLCSYLFDSRDGIGHQQQSSFANQSSDQHTDMQDDVRSEFQHSHGQPIAMHRLFIRFSNIDRSRCIPTIELVTNQSRSNVSSPSLIDKLPVEERHFVGRWIEFGETVGRLFEIILALSSLVIFEFLSLQQKDLLDQITLLIS